MRLYAFGDTGGHYLQLARALIQLGVDLDTYVIPDDVSIIHLGDLIHKGPHSNELVELIDNLIENNPGQWIQLLGNHESQHLSGGHLFWRCDCSQETIATLNRWYILQKAYIAYSRAEVLFTHSGITRELWERIGEPGDAFSAAEKLNTLSAGDAFKPGTMLAKDKTQTYKNPGPVWALSTWEVFNSWAYSKKRMPFVQAHGHTSAYDWERDSWYPAPKEFFLNAKVLEESRALFVEVAGSYLIGLDPSFETSTPNIEVQPYIIFDN